MVLLLVGGGAAAIGAGYLLVELAEETRLTTSLVYRIDQEVHAWFGHVRQPVVTVLLGTATTLGGTAGLSTLVAVVAALLLARKERASAIAEAQWYSYPSGHAMSSFITFGALAHLALRRAWPWVARSVWLSTAVAAFELLLRLRGEKVVGP